MSNPSNDLTILVDSYLGWERDITEANATFGTITCGKPHHGFKARCKLDRIIRQSRTFQADDLAAIRVWARGTTKMSKERRTHRFEQVKALIPSFTLE